MWPVLNAYVYDTHIELAEEKVLPRKLLPI